MKLEIVGAFFAILKVCSSVALADSEGATSTNSPTTYPSVNAINATKCPTNWRHFGTKCYKFFSNKAEGVGNKNFADARTFCEEIPGSLATIHSQEELDFITTYLGEPSVRNRIWIGLKKNAEAVGSTKYDFRWVDGEPLGNYSNFALGEPNGQLWEQCVHLDASEAIAGQWNDVSCDEKMGFVCQFNLTSGAKEGNGLVENPNCPPGFKYYLDVCYRVEETVEDWFNAEESCRAKYDGHLLSVVDLYEETYLSLLTSGITSEIWLGLSDTNQATIGFFRWSDNRPIYHTNWDTNEPQEKSDQRCVAMKSNKKWNVHDCSTKLRYICTKHQKDRNHEPPPAAGSCPPPWVDIGNNYCYFLEVEESLPFSYAQRECENLGVDLTYNASLATIHSQHDLTLLRPHLRRYTQRRFYVGIKERQYGHYYFVNEEDSEADFLPWEHGEPNNNEREKCVELITHHMTYNNLNCRDSKNFICQADKNFHPKVSSHPDTKGLSGGAVTALVLVMLLLIAGFAGAAFYFYRKKSLDDKMNAGIFQFHNEAVDNQSHI